MTESPLTDAEIAAPRKRLFIGLLTAVCAVVLLLAFLLWWVPSVGLVNLVAGRELAPELLQDDATGVNIARAIENLLEDEDKLNQLRRRLMALRDVLGGAGASDRVAQLALGMIETD